MTRVFSFLRRVLRKITHERYSSRDGRIVIEGPRRWRLTARRWLRKEL
jgi:hypothetical protein